MKPIHPPFLLVVLSMVLATASSCKDDKTSEPPEKASVRDSLAPVTGARKKPEPREKTALPAPRAAPEAAKAGAAVPKSPAASSAHKSPREAAPAQGMKAAKPVSSQSGVEETNIPDLRLLLTATDVAQVGGARTAFRRRAMPGMAVTPDQDALYYEPEKGSSYGFGVQVFHDVNAAKAKQRFESMFASYPNSVEIAPVAGNTFFAYWDEVLFVSFMHQYKGMIVVLSCGRPYCDSDSLYALAKKVGSRIR